MEREGGRNRDEGWNFSCVGVYPFEMRPLGKGGRKLGPSCPDGIHSFPLCYCGGFYCCFNAVENRLTDSVFIRLDVTAFSDESRIQQFRL